MSTLEEAKRTAEFFTKTNGEPHLVLDNNKDGSEDKFITAAVAKIVEKKIPLTDPRIVYRTTPAAELMDPKTTEKTPAAKAPAAAKAATAAKAPAAKAAATTTPKPATVPAAPVMKADHTMATIPNDLYNWFLDHGLTINQGLIITQKYHSALEKQVPGTADEKLQRLATPKATDKS
jgi:hypothetical protein